MLQPCQFKISTADQWLFSFDILDPYTDEPVSEETTYLRYSLLETPISTTPLWQGELYSGIEYDPVVPGRIHVFIPACISRYLPAGVYTYLINVVNKEHDTYSRKLEGNIESVVMSTVPESILGESDPVARKLIGEETKRAMTAEAALEEKIKHLEPGGGGIPDDGSVTTEKLADLAVTTQKLASKAVTPDKLADSAKLTAQNLVGPLSEILEVGNVYTKDTAGSTVELRKSGDKIYMDFTFGKADEEDPPEPVVETVVMDGANTDNLMSTTTAGGRIYPVGTDGINPGTVDMTIANGNVGIQDDGDGNLIATVVTGQAVAMSTLGTINYTTGSWSVNSASALSSDSTAAIAIKYKFTTKATTVAADKNFGELETTSFAGKFSPVGELGIKPYSILITISNSFIIRDDGNGNLVHNSSSIGAVSYVTGVWSVSGLPTNLKGGLVYATYMYLSQKGVDVPVYVDGEGELTTCVNGGFAFVDPGKGGIQPSSVIIKGSSKFIVDNGEGGLVSGNTSVGTIDYATGRIYVSTSFFSPYTPIPVSYCYTDYEEIPSTETVTRVVDEVPLHNDNYNVVARLTTGNKGIVPGSLLIYGATRHYFALDNGDGTITFNGTSTIPGTIDYATGVMRLGNNSSLNQAFSDAVISYSYKDDPYYISEDTYELQTVEVEATKWGRLEELGNVGIRPGSVIMLFSYSGHVYPFVDDAAGSLGTSGSGANYINYQPGTWNCGAGLSGYTESSITGTITYQTVTRQHVTQSITQATLAIAKSAASRTWAGRLTLGTAGVCPGSVTITSEDSGFYTFVDDGHGTLVSTVRPGDSTATVDYDTGVVYLGNSNNFTEATVTYDTLDDTEAEPSTVKVVDFDLATSSSGTTTSFTTRLAFPVYTGCGIVPGSVAIMAGTVGLVDDGHGTLGGSGSFGNTVIGKIDYSTGVISIWPQYSSFSASTPIKVSMLAPKTYTPDTEHTYTEESLSFSADSVRALVTALGYEAYADLGSTAMDINEYRIVPGSISGSCFDDGEGRLYFNATQLGTVDYETGRLAFNNSASSYLRSATLTFIKSAKELYSDVTYASTITTEVTAKARASVSATTTYGSYLDARLYAGTGIVPGSLLGTNGTAFVLDDGEGNLKFANGSSVVGSVNYTTGVFILTSSSYGSLSSNPMNISYMYTTKYAQDPVETTLESSNFDTTRDYNHFKGGTFENYANGIVPGSVFTNGFYDDGQGNLYYRGSKAGSISYAGATWVIRDFGTSMESANPSITATKANVSLYPPSTDVLTATDELDRSTREFGGTLSAFSVTHTGTLALIPGTFLIMVENVGVYMDDGEGHIINYNGSQMSDCSVAYSTGVWSMKLTTSGTNHVTIKYAYTSTED